MNGERWGWIGVDLDGTLAKYDKWVAVDHIGEPVPEMVLRVLRWLRQGYKVKIFTARVSNLERAPKARLAIAAWCDRHIGQQLEVTCMKDYAMIELWDDRCVGVEHNTGRPLGPSPGGYE